MDTLPEARLDNTSPDLSENNLDLMLSVSTDGGWDERFDTDGADPTYSKLLYTELTLP